MEGRIDMGHARALLALQGAQQTELARKVERDGSSVRETEQLVNAILNPKEKKPPVRARTDRDTARLQEEISERLGTTVEIKPGKKGSGKLIVGYMSHAHLDQLLAKLTS